MLKKFKSFRSELAGIDSGLRQQLFYASIVLFSLFFSYPIVRSTVDATFLDLHGADKSPFVWVYSVIALSVVVWIYNMMYKRMKVQKLFVATALLTVGLLFGCSYAVSEGLAVAAYPLFIVKEVYIVLLFHMMMGWLNSAVSLDLAKLIYGPIGAINNLSGIFGGLLMAKLTYHMSVPSILGIGTMFILVAAWAFSRLGDEGVMTPTDEDKGETPFKAIKPVFKYVSCIAIMILLTQVAITLANFKFYSILDSAVDTKIEKTRIIGNAITAINILSSVLQIFFVPVILRVCRNRNVHFFIPVTYIIATFLGYIVAGNYLLAVACTFVFFKGVDYSLFSTAKELLYFPLTSKQKYGAKYIIDMVVYRLGKGLISFFLGFQLVKDYLTPILFSSLVLWIVVLIPLFCEMKKILDHKKGDVNESVVS